MRRAVWRGVWLGVAVLAGVRSPVVAEAPPRLKLAQDLARAHAAWPPGRAWLADNQPRTGELLIPVLNRCVPDAPDGELTAFSVYLRLSQEGRIQEVVTDIDAELGRCMTDESREVRLPKAPRQDFWVQVNLAATL